MSIANNDITLRRSKGLSLTYDELDDNFQILEDRILEGVDVNDISSKTTDDLTEGSTNLYYTNARADARADGRVNALVTKVYVDGLGVRAASADKLHTARTIALGGDVSGSVSFNGTSNVTINATVADDSHNHIIGNVDGLQTALDGKSSTGHGHIVSDVSGLQTTLDGKSAIGHGHSISDITNLQTSLDGKLAVGAKAVDADKLDGLNSTQFLRNDVESTASAKMNFTSGVKISGTVGDPALSNLEIESGAAQIKLTDNSTDTDDFYIHANTNKFWILTDTNEDGTWDGNAPLQLDNIANNGFLYNQRIFADNYHPNADKLTTARTITLGDDLSGSVNFDGSGNVTLNGNVNYMSVVDRRADGDTLPNAYKGNSITTFFTDDLPSGNGWDSGIAVKGWGDSAYGVWQLFSNSGTSNADDLYFRRGNNSSWGSLQKIWTNQNDGVGSGLDADLLDGLDSAQFLRSDVDVNMQGNIWFEEKLDDLIQFWKKEYAVGLQGSTLFARTHKRFSIFQGGSYDVVENNPGVYVDPEGIEPDKPGVRLFTVSYKEGAGQEIKYLDNNIFHDTYHPNADKLTTARTIALGGDLSGSASFDGSSNITINATVDGAGSMQADIDSKQTIYRASKSITNNSYTRVARVVGTNLGSMVTMTVIGTSSNVVMSTIFDISVSYLRDIQIVSRTTDYSGLTLKIVSDDSDEYDIWLQHTGPTSPTVATIEIHPMSGEVVTWSPTAAAYTGQEFIHTAVRSEVIYNQSENTVNIRTDGLFYTNNNQRVYADNYHPDSDKLGGLTPSQFVRSDTDDTLSGNYTINGTGTIAGSNFDAGWLKIGTSGTGWSIDSNEIYGSGPSASIIGTLGGDLSILPAGDCNISPGGIARVSGARIFTDAYHPNADKLTTARTITLGGDLSGSASFDGSGNITISGQVADNSHNHTTLTGVTLISTSNGSTRDKYRVWGGAPYSIGMETGFTFGGLNNDYAMTFQMNNSSNRGFWWGDDGDTNAQGAMALTTDGKLTVASFVRIGYGGGDTTIPDTHALDINGTTMANGDIMTTRHVEAGYGSGSIALTVNDGYGNANLAFNHKNGVPDVAGNALRIETNVDATSNPTMVFEMKANVAAGAAVTLDRVFQLKEDEVLIDSTGKDALVIQKKTNAGGIGIKFTDATALTQTGGLYFYHQDVESAGSKGASFRFETTEGTMSLDLPVNSEIYTGTSRYYHDGYHPDADKLTGIAPNYGNVGTTVALRNGSGDIVARLFKSEYFDQTSIPTYASLAFRNNDSNDNFIRFGTPDAVKNYAKAIGVTEETWTLLASYPTRKYNGTITLSQSHENFDYLVINMGHFSFDANNRDFHWFPSNRIWNGNEIGMAGASSWARWTVTNNTTLTFISESSSWMREVWGVNK